MANLRPPSSVGRWPLVAAAVLALLLGLAVYLTARRAGSALAIPAAGMWRPPGLPGAPGAAVAGWLPDLLHPFAFTLLTAAAGPLTARRAGGAAVFWWAVDSAAEALQHPVAAAWLAAGAVPLPGLETLAAYARHGTFDIADLLAIAAGALLAAALLRFWMAKEIPHAH